MVSRRRARFAFQADGPAQEEFAGVDSLDSGECQEARVGKVP